MKERRETVNRPDDSVDKLKPKQLHQSNKEQGDLLS
jgi:hypothetical protein